MNIKVSKDFLKSCIQECDGCNCLVISCPDEIGLKALSESECNTKNCTMCWKKAIEEGDDNE